MNPSDMIEELMEEGMSREEAVQITRDELKKREARMVDVIKHENNRVTK